ncbi:hypothetical protein BDN70DRAFT_922529 [Pholiota conissans]|uniref:Uncharacterized protein n=1 Tax=Pholiota conissans TaxID=109636 RepID=A0A9P5YZU9_9AGAR|nr:hypothetical protein BDN70DRAFT_922529 [Pholiota conissans]
MKTTHLFVGDTTSSIQDMLAGRRTCVIRGRVYTDDFDMESIAGDNGMPINGMSSFKYANRIPNGETIRHFFQLANEDMGHTLGGNKYEKWVLQALVTDKLFPSRKLIDTIYSDFVPAAFAQVSEYYKCLCEKGFVHLDIDAKTMKFRKNGNEICILLCDFDQSRSRWDQAQNREPALECI